MNEKRKPAFTLRIGKLKATAWKNSSGESSFMSYKLTRSYRDKEGNWTETDSYGIEDMPVLVTLAAEIQRRHLSASDADTHGPSDAATAA